MTKLELERIYELENSSNESQNMLGIAQLINEMTFERSVVVELETSIRLGEGSATQYEDNKQSAQARYTNAKLMLRDEMAKKSQKELKEYLSLIRSEAFEELMASPAPIHVSPQQRAKMSLDQEVLVADKLAAKCKVDCLNDAQNMQRAMERGNSGK